jgi:hypothetical protein
MAEISQQQIYDLLIEISRDVAELDASIDELLLDMKALNRAFSVDRQRFTPQARSL